MQEIPLELIQRAQKGSIEAFEEIYKISSGFVYSVAMRVTANKADAEEVTQDVFVKVHKKLSTFESRAALTSWLYRVTMNTALDMCKKRKRHQDREVTVEGVLQQESVEPEARRGLEKENHEQKVQELLSVLNPDQKACVILREIEGLDYKEIAATLDINLNTVRSRLKRAREALFNYTRKGVVEYEL